MSDSSAIGVNLNESNWTSFSMALCQLVQDSLFVQNNGALCEAVIFEKLREVNAKVVIDGQRVLIRVIRGEEGTAADSAFVAIVLDQATDTPLDTASDRDLWKWARGGPPGVHFIPVEFKFTSVTIGRATGSIQFYTWSASHKYAQRAPDSEVVISIVEGVGDHVAILPTATYVRAPSWPRTHSSDTIQARAPVWFPPFMVDLRQVGEAVVSIVVAALSNASPYVNPTTGVSLTGWRPRHTADPRIAREPEALGARGRSSVQGSLRLFYEIEHAGLACSVESNYAAPVGFDFCLLHPKLGRLHVEEKTAKSWQALLPNLHMLGQRINPLASRRIWHVLYMHSPDGVLCFTRDEVSQIQLLSESRLDDLIATHRFADFRSSFAHIEAHAAQAKAAVTRVIYDLQPADMSQDLPDEVLWLQDLARDALDTSTHQLPWLSRQINFQAMKARFGVCLPLGRGHPLGTHVIIAYAWTSDNVARYLRDGTLPLSLWSPGQRLRCIVLRFQDCAPRSNISIYYPLTVQQSDTTRTVPGQRCFVVGSTKPAALHENGEPRNASYLLLPDEFTILSRETDQLEPQCGTEDGAHFWRSEGVYWRGQKTRSDWDYAYGHQGFRTFMADKQVEPLRYMLNVADGTFNQQIENIFKSEGGSARIGSPRYPGNKTFLVAPYITTLAEVHQCAWDYGRTKQCQNQEKIPDEGDAKATALD
ncbi:hypothetical protein LTR12_011006 [Friedmanniomyces endolithicus]|nr:hypothetical protein LTR12_011006 [Friedmanniomyces endolithicus]